MRRLMEYKIISGRTTEVRQVMMETRRGPIRQRRGVRVKGRTSLKKILANEREAVKNLARILNCNFRAGDLWVTLTYPDEALPESKEAARAQFEKFLRKLRRVFRENTGESLRYVVTTSDRGSASGDPVRIHHHLVMDAVAYETITRLWPAEDVSYRRLDGRGDYTGIARYMVSNAGPADGKKRWSTSKGLKKPVYTEPVPVDRGERIRIPKGAAVKAKEDYTDEETGMRSAYARYVRPARQPGPARC